MATPPTFTAGSVLTAAQINAVGLWMIKSEAIGSGVASYVATGVFSSDYDAYRVVIQAVDGSAGDQWLQLTFGSTAGTAYYGSIYYDKSDGTSTGTTRVNGGAFIRVALTGTDDDTMSTFDITTPYLAKRTQVRGFFGNTLHTGWFGGTLANTTSYTGFTLTPASGTLTAGSVTVYGYRKV